ncbi:MAG: ADP-ribosylglycohydrolase family protein [Geminicoccaceae bacterium]
MAERSRGENVEARASVALGALVADAAAMGLHWLYDPDRIANIAEERDPMFLAAEQRHFDDAKGYFAHDGKRAGELSQYGATLTLAMHSLVSTKGKVDIADYQRRYLAFFGPGGDWKGYIDRPTRGTLAHLGSQVDDGVAEVSGVDDDQMPAFSTVPAVVAAGPEAPSLDADVVRMVRVTNDNPVASEAGLITARIAGAALSGKDLATTLAGQAEAAGEVLKPLLREALASDDRSSVDIAGHFGRACHVQQGLPVVFHIAAHAESYESAIRTNVLAGGDSCGRSIALGAILGARFGFGGERGIPLPWLTRLEGGARLFDLAYRLASF